MNIRRFVADLHVHTLLSPCGDIMMSPHNVVRTAAAAGVDILAITDHNAGDNIAAAIMAAAEYGVTVLPGMEIESREEVHVLTLFGKMREYRSWEQIVRQNLSPLPNDDEKFGIQAIVNADDELVGVRTERLIASTRLPLNEIVDKVNGFGGLCIAAHIDKKNHSILGQLGFVPPDLPLAAVEVSRFSDPATVRLKGIGKLPVITSSDAHYIEDLEFGSKTELFLAEPTLAEIRLALTGKDGRSVAGYRLDKRIHKL